MNIKWHEFSSNTSRKYDYIISDMYVASIDSKGYVSTDLFNNSNKYVFIKIHRFDPFRSLTIFHEPIVITILTDLDKWVYLDQDELGYKIDWSYHCIIPVKILTDIKSRLKDHVTS